MATLKPSLTLVDNEEETPERGNAGGHADGVPGQLESRLQAMRQMLESAPHASAAEALAMLRQAFPDADLSDRVRALGYRLEA
ncbi:hypothetical protein [Breoghania sp. JC706]|uniref:hypothetical protein n=1 Tax=Breoghania sp. JC706 TaxID=3117732 RepID=UPI00300A32FD